MKYYLSIILLVLISCNQNKTETEPDKKNSDSVSLYISKSSDKKGSRKVRLENVNKAFILLQKSNSKKVREELFKIADSYKNLKQEKKYKQALKTILNYSIKAKDSESIGKLYNLKANHYIDLGKNDSSYIYFVKAEKIFYNLKDSISLGNNYLEKGYIQVSIGDFFGCEQSSGYALLYLKNANLYKKEYYAYNYIGICSNELKNYENAITYHKKALDVARNNNFNGVFHYQSVSLNNIGVVYQNMSNHKEAIVTFSLALKEKDLLKDNPDLYIKLLDNLAYSKFKLKDFSELPKLFYKSLKISDSLKLSSIAIKIHLSEYYEYINDNQKSIEFGEKALRQGRNQKSYAFILSSLKQLSIVDKKNSSNYYNEYIKLSDSLQLAERNSKERFARLQYETDEIIQQNEGLEEQNRNLLVIFIIVFIIVALLFVVRAQRARTRELLYKQAQQKANEDIYNLMMSQQAIIDESRSKEKKRLAQDLHDGVLGRMFGLRLNLDSLNHNNDDESIRRRFDLLNELKTIEQDIREISHDLNREKQVLINNFVSIVHNLLEDQKSLHEANLVYSIDNEVNWDKVANAIKINMYRILQEGLQNINKYATAKNINVEIKGDKEKVYLKIQDDGVGFDVSRKSKGIGMQNMISRTQECQGIIDISSKKNEGTKITITLPIETKQITVEQE